MRCQTFARFSRTIRTQKRSRDHARRSTAELHRSSSFCSLKDTVKVTLVWERMTQVTVVVSWDYQNKEPRTGWPKHQVRSVSQTRRWRQGCPLLKAGGGGRLRQAPTCGRLLAGFGSPLPQSCLHLRLAPPCVHGSIQISFFLRTPVMRIKDLPYSS